MPQAEKYGIGQIVLESDKEIVLPIKQKEKKRYYVLEKDGEEYTARPGWRGIKATFKLPFKTSLLLDFDYKVLLQFSGPRHVFVKFYHADLYQVYRWLTSKFQSQFRLKKPRLPSELLMMFDRWRMNRDYLLFQFKHNPEETLHFVKANLPKLVTVLSLRKIPRDFDEQFKFTFGID